MKRLLVTGSREWDNVDVMEKALKTAFRDLKKDMNVPENALAPIWLISGHAIGADKMAEKIWEHRVDKDQIERHPAKDFSHPLKRNDHMVSLGADVCVAFLTPCYKPGCQAGRGFHFTHGGQYTATKAEKAGIPTFIIEDPTKPPF